MAEKNIYVRLAATGGGQVRQELTGIGSAGQDALAKVDASAAKASAGIKRVGQAANDVGRRAGGGDGFRNLGFQVQDFAVQVGAGTSATQAMAQQLPQLASGFGPVGIAIGTASAVLIPLTAALIGAAGGAKEFEGKLKAAEDSSKALAAAVTAAAAPLADLKNLYGESADEVERLNRATLNMAKVQSLAALKSVAAELGGIAGSSDTSRPAGPMNLMRILGAVSGVDQQYMVQMSAAQKAQKDLADTYRISFEAAGKLQAALRGVSAAATETEALDASLSLMEALVDIAGSADKANTKFADLWKMAADVAGIASDNVKSLNEDAKVMTATFVDGISKLEQLKGMLDTALPGAGGMLGRATDWIRNFHDTKGAEFTAGSKGILDLIGWAEGTDRGRGYNETLGYGAYTGGPVNLVNMKIDEVLELQRRMLAHPDNTYNSSAVGRYQIVGTTLRGLKSQLGLKGDELFDEAMQDRMGMQLARQRAEQGSLRGWYDEWQGFEAKGVSMAAITGALGVKSLGVDPGVAAARKAENDELKRGMDLRAAFVANLEQQVMAAASEAEAAGKSAFEQARLRAEMMLTQDAKAKGIDLAEKMAGSEKTYGQAIRETSLALAQAAQEQAAQDDLRKQAEDRAKASADAMNRLRDSLKSGFDTAFASIIDGTKSVADAFKDMVAQMLAQAAAAQFSKGMGGLIDGLFGGGGDPLAGALIGAGVGNVTPAGGGWGASLARAATGAVAQAVQVTVGIDPKNGNVTAYTDQRVSMRMAQADRAMPSRVQAINRDPLKVG